MNYLAHIFLSHKQPEIAMGNFLGDLITNKEYQQLPINLRKGAELHRKIDYFTDNHAIVDKAVEILHPYHHKYAPVVIDIFYDYFLSYNWHLYSNESLDDFSQWAYDVIEEYQDYIPKKHFAKVMKMIEHNWLTHYGNLEQLHHTFLRVKQRAKFPNSFELSTQHLEKHINILNEGFNRFFPEVIEMSQEFVHP